MADVVGRILIKAPQRMSHGSVAGVLSFGGKIPANSNSVFTSCQSPFRAPAIARSAVCNSRCWVEEGRVEEDILGASGGVGGEGVRATRASLRVEDARRPSKTEADLATWGLT